MTDSLTPEKLDELERLEREAMTAPWKADDVKNIGENWLLATFGSDSRNTEVILSTDRVHASETNGATAWDDARLVAAVRNALPALIAAARERDALMAQLNIGGASNVPYLQRMRELADRAEAAERLGREAALEKAVRVVEEAIDPDCGCGGVRFCEGYGCSTLREIAAKIRQGPDVEASAETPTTMQEAVRSVAARTSEQADRWAYESVYSRDVRVLQRLKDYAEKCRQEGRESVAHQAIAIWAIGVLDKIREFEAQEAQEQAAVDPEQRADPVERQ